MSWLRFSATGLILGAYILIGSGCASQPVKVRRPVYPLKKVVVPPRVVRPPVVAPTPEPVSVADRGAAGREFGIDRIAKRLAVYEGRLYQWRAVTDQLRAAEASTGEPLPNGWEVCLQRLEATYGDYNRLRRQIVAGADGDGDAISPWEVVDEDFAYQESGCTALFRERAAQPVAGQRPSVDREGVGSRFCEAVRQGKYQQALDLYRDIDPDSSGQAVTVAVQQAHVVALLRTNRIDEALAGLRNILANSGGFDSWTAQRQVADLLLATGKREAAAERYEALSAAFDRLDKEKGWVHEQLALLASGDDHDEELSIYGQALRSYLTFDGKRVPGELKMWVARLEYKYPGSAIAGKARQLLNQVESESRTWISDRLLEVDALVEARRYTKALAMLEDLAGQDLPKEMLDVVGKTMDEVVIAAAREQEEKRQRTEEMLQDRWREADHLFDSEQFDEAIVVFSSLFGTADDVKARVKIGDAAALAAAKLRREGAALFFKAGQTADAGQKRELLMQSRQLLQTILVKYPYVDLVEKVARNLQIIDEQLRTLGPLSEDGVDVGGNRNLSDGQSGSGDGDGAFPW